MNGLHISSVVAITSTLATGSFAGTVHYQQFDLNSLPLTFGESSYEFETRFGVDFTVSRLGYPLGVEDIGRRNGGRALSPFRFERQEQPTFVNFSTGINSFSIRMGDFGQDTPDRLRITAYDGSGDIVGIDTGRLTTGFAFPPGFDIDDIDSFPEPPLGPFEDELLSVRGEGIRSIELSGGSQFFPQSVYLDDLSVGYEAPLVPPQLVAKSQALAAIAGEELNEELLVAGGGFGTAVTICSHVAFASPYTALACGAIAGYYVASNAKLAYDIYQVVKDPPDPDYASVFSPREVSQPKFLDTDGLPEDVAEFLVSGLQGLAERAALMEAWLVTQERYGGAVEAGDTEAAAMQQQALDDLLVKIAIKTEAASEFGAELHSAIEVLLDGTEITPEEVNAARAEIAENGLPDFVRDALHYFQVPDAEITALVNLELGQISDASVDLEVLYLANEKIQESLFNTLSCTNASCIVRHGNILLSEPTASELVVKASFTEPGAILDILLGEEILGSIFATPDRLGPDGSITTRFALDRELLSAGGFREYTAVLRGEYEGIVGIENVRVAAVPLPEAAAGYAAGLASFVVLLGWRRRATA